MAFSALEKAMALVIGLDITVPGTTRKIAMKALTVAAQRIAPVTVPAAGALGPALPIALGAGLGYAALQTDPGQQLLEAAAERGRQDRARFEQAKQFLREAALMEDPILEAARGRGTIGRVFTRKRRPSSFNKAVSAGMKAVKKSTSYGGKGVIKPATKVFAMVTKLASAKKKKRKAPKSGIRRRIWNAMKGLR